MQKEPLLLSFAPLVRTHFKISPVHKIVVLVPHLSEPLLCCSTCLQSLLLFALTYKALENWHLCFLNGKVCVFHLILSHIKGSIISHTRSNIRENTVNKNSEEIIFMLPSPLPGKILRGNVSISLKQTFYDQNCILFLSFENCFLFLIFPGCSLPVI